MAGIGADAGDDGLTGGFMIKSGLVSVTFRRKTPEEICELCTKAGLKAIEWGGDVHVPAGDFDTAWRVRELSAQYGIEICAYGSYYHAGDEMEEFMRSLETAEELGAPVMRIWCGRRGSGQADDEYRQVICENLRSICGIAAERDIDIALEFHSGTLTDDIESVRRLLDETADIENLRFYWQPRWDWTEEMRLAALELVKPRIAYVHTFTWEHTPDIIRLDLDKGEEMWKKALNILGNGYALLEFVVDDSDEALVKDAAALNGWIAEVHR